MHTSTPAQSKSHTTSEAIFSMLRTRIIIDGQITDTYGIEVSSPGSAPVLQYPDISTDGEKLSRLIDLMNELEVDPIHTKYVIEDFLVDHEV
ncbi:MAG: hypothetical protein IJX47_03175 [Clostridia bacterium]|nr:hypothetical protein [Clostridia bacterium]